MRLTGKMPRFKGAKPALIGNKGSRQAMFPSKKAVEQVMKGDPTQQSLSNYAKLTPSGLAGMIQPYDDITNMGIQPAIQDE